RYTVRINLVRTEAFRLKKYLMAGLIRKAMNLVFDGGTISRANTFYFSLIAIHGRAIQAGPDYFVSALIGMGYPARKLFRMHSRAAQIGKHRHRIAVTGLHFGFAEIDTSGVYAWRGSRLQAALRQFQFFQAL